MVRVPRAALERLTAGPVPTSEVDDRAIQALRATGATIRETEGTYRLQSVGDGGAAVAADLAAPFAIDYHETVDSTNRVAREHVDAGETDVVVLADEQTGGRGRRDRDWTSPSGGVWMSILTTPTLPSAEYGLLTFAAAVSVVEAAAAVGAETYIKWPNDVLATATDEKVAGILTETGPTPGTGQWAVVGIGVNAAVPETILPDGATSLTAVADELDRVTVTRRTIDTFDTLRSESAAILSAWRRHARTIGRRVRVETATTDIVGQAVAVTETGALVVETDAGRQEITAGDCQHLRAL